MGKSLNGKVAVACIAVAFILIFIAFTTPNWLSTDGELKDAKFEKIGLWEVCFREYQEVHFRYDTKLTGCWWVFEEEYYIIHDKLLPGFFVATQFFYTLCFTLLLVGSFLTILYGCCSKHHQRYRELLLAVGANLTLSGICGLIAVIIFGAYGDARDWMPDWEHNGLGWSFVLAVIGSFILLIGGILFLVEARRHMKKTRRILEEETKTQTTI